jgi:hypothetical protein
MGTRWAQGNDVCSLRVLEQSLSDLIHRLPMIVAWEQMAVAIHRDLQRRVTGERLHRLGRKPRLDPSRHSKMSEAVPVETLHPHLIEQRQEPTLDQIIVPNVPGLEGAVEVLEVW